MHLISLQHGDGREQLAGVADRFHVVDLGEDVDRLEGAFMDTAAIIENLDLVITSDTSTAHVAGGLAARVWLALSFSPEWRWMRDGDSNPWYPDDAVVPPDGASGIGPACLPDGQRA